MPSFFSLAHPLATREFYRSLWGGNEIILGKRSLSADTALRLARYFGNSAKFWINLQAQFDLDSEEARIGTEIESKIKPYSKAA